MAQKKFCAPTVIHGLLEIQKVRDKFRDQKIELTYAESIKIGNYYFAATISWAAIDAALATGVKFTSLCFRYLEELFQDFHGIKNVISKKTTFSMIRIVTTAKLLQPRNSSKTFKLILNYDLLEISCDLLIYRSFKGRHKNWCRPISKTVCPYRR